MPVYVDGVNGSNLNGGASQGDAFATIAFALANCSNNDQIFVRGNTSYAVAGEEVSQATRIKLTGCASDWSVDGTRVSLTTSNLSSSYALEVTGLCSIENFKITMDSLMTAVIDASTYIQDFDLSNCELIGDSTSAIIDDNSSNGTEARLHGCKISGFTNDVINGPSNRAKPDFFDCFIDGITTQSGSGNANSGKVWGCICVDCDFDGVNISDYTYRNCIFDGCRVELGDRGSTSTPFVVTNCVFINSAGYGIESPVTSIEPITTLQNVCFFNNTSGDLDPNISWTGTNVFNADPKFVDAVNGDYSLQSDSPLIDAGFASIGNNIGPKTASQSGGGSPVTTGYAI